MLDRSPRCLVVETTRLNSAHSRWSVAAYRGRDTDRKSKQTHTPKRRASDAHARHLLIARLQEYLHSQSTAPPPVSAKGVRPFGGKRGFDSVRGVGPPLIVVRPVTTQSVLCGKVEAKQHTRREPPKRATD